MTPIDAGEVALEEAKLIAARQHKILGSAGKPLMGVAFSGGGIRSATYNLGIVQGIARSGLLPRIDYLSTVSGGGYVGTWLHGVIRRFGGGDPSSATLRNLLTRPESSPHGEPKEDPVAFLRKYSSYLAPDMGLFSADFWVIAGIWLRNILLNQLVILPFIAAVSLLTFSVGSLMGWHVKRAAHLSADLGIAALAMSFLAWFAGCGVGSVALDAFNRDSDGTVCDGPSRKRWDSATTAATCSMLMLLGALSMAVASDSLHCGGWMSGRPWLAVIIGLVLSLMFGLLQWHGKFSECFEKRHNRTPWFGPWAYPLLAGIPTGFLIFGVMRALVGLDGDSAGLWNTVAWGPPLLVLALLAGASLHIGLMGVDYNDNAREWLARLGAYTVLASFAWAALFAISVFGPYWITNLAVVSWAPVAGLGGGWVLTSIAGAVTGSSSRTPSKPQEGSGGGFRGLITAVAPTVFIIGYLLVVSLALHMAIAALCGAWVKPPLAATPPPVTLHVSAEAAGARSIQVNVKDTGVTGAPGAVRAAASTESRLLHENPDFLQEALTALALLIGAIATICYLPRRIDINEFSMHHFYKNRLVRCYLGATKGNARRPSRLTGFDPSDDIPLATLVPENDYFGPFALVNTCINLNRGSELAKLERKGAAFLFSPLYSGYDPPHSDQDRQTMDKSGHWQSGDLHPCGYRATKGFGYPEGFTIGTCMGISGAAASPNGGYHTSGPTAFLMTLFSVRLGWWVGNTRRDKPSSQPGPTHSLVAILSELFAFTDATSNFISLSDGGHFENLGLYELVRRRCRYIIAGDGEQDGEYTFESLGGAIRKCRTDFGAEITIDPRRIHPKDGASATHCVVGRITYPGDSEPTGWLLYLKSSLTGDEPEDVAQYKSSHPNFPQEPTSNQFFTESQFESYRKLGLHVWNSAFEGIPFDPEGTDLERLFENLQRKWTPVPEGAIARPMTAGSN